MSNGIKKIAKAIGKQQQKERTGLPDKYLLNAQRRMIAERDNDLANAARHAEMLEGIISVIMETDQVDSVEIPLEKIKEAMARGILKCEWNNETLCITPVLYADRSGSSPKDISES